MTMSMPFILKIQIFSCIFLFHIHLKNVHVGYRCTVPVLMHCSPLSNNKRFTYLLIFTFFKNILKVLDSI